MSPELKATFGAIVGAFLAGIGVYVFLNETIDKRIGETAPGLIEEKMSQLRILPLGSIVAWHRDVAGDTTLPEGWVECDGRALDSGSPLYSSMKNIPNLNLDGLFLRGGRRSGNLQVDAIRGHVHRMYRVNPGRYSKAIDPRGGADDNVANDGSEVVAVTGFQEGAEDETRPKNMSVIWIMKIK